LGVRPLARFSLTANQSLVVAAFQGQDQLVEQTDEFLDSGVDAFALTFRLTGSTK